MAETADVPEVERQDPNGGAIDCKQVRWCGFFIARRDRVVAVTSPCHRHVDPARGGAGLLRVATMVDYHAPRGSVNTKGTEAEPRQAFSNSKPGILLFRE